MVYTRENIERQASTYRKIRQAGGVETVSDVYVRDATQSKFWFIGKLSRCTGTVTLERAVARQLTLLQQHAIRVRPVELGRSLMEEGKFEVWVAPGDSEQACSANDINTVLEQVKVDVENRAMVPLDQVGFDCQVVLNQGVGFYVERRDDGSVPPELIQFEGGEFE